MTTAVGVRRECGATVYWWDGEYEGDCELPEGHEERHHLYKHVLPKGVTVTEATDNLKHASGL